MAAQEEIVLRFKGDASSGLSALSQIGKALQELGKDLEQAKQSTSKGGFFSFLGQVGGQLKSLKGTFSSAFSSIFSGLGKILNPLGLVSGGFKALGGVIQTAFGFVAGSAINSISQMLSEVAGKPLAIASRVEVLEDVFYFLGQKAGYTKDKLEGFLEGLRDTGITTQEAARNLTRMIQAQLDLSKASELARVAQDAAVISGENSSQAYEGIMHGIVSLSPIVLRHHGIYVNLEEAYRRFADAAGRSTDSLSIQEKQMIATEEVIRSGATIAGAYTTAMGDVGKKLTSLPRYAEEAALAIGRGFTPVLGVLVDILSESLKSVQSWFEERRSTFEGFGLAAAEGLRDGWGQVKSFLAEITRALRLDSDPTSWFRGGMELVASLADGILSGISDYIIPAVISVTETIANFLMGASPPRLGLLSTIDKWGIPVMNAYLRGFAQADFGILSGATGMIRQALQTSVDLGDLPEKKLIPALSKVRGQVIELLSNFRTTGEISEEALGKISKALGASGKDIVEYLRLQLQHQKALKDMEVATEEYAAAEKRGFVPAELQARLDAAKEEAERAQDALSWQEELIKAQQDSVDLQAEQVKLMERLTKSMETAAAKMAKATPEYAWGEFLDRYSEDMRVLEEKKARGLISEEEYLKGLEQLYAQYVDQAMRLGQPYEAQAEQLVIIRDKIKAIGAEVGEEAFTPFGSGIDAIGKKVSEATASWKEKFTAAFEPLGKLKAPLGELGETIRGFLGAQKTTSPAELRRNDWLGAGVTEAYEQGRALREAFDLLVEGIKSLPGAVKDFGDALGKIKQEYWDPLPDWVKSGVGTTLGIGLALKLTGLTPVIGLLLKGLMAAGGALGLGGSAAAGLLIASLYVAVKPFMSEEVRQEWVKTWESLKSGGDVLTVGAEASQTTLEHTPLMSQLLNWTDTSLTPAITSAWSSLKVKATNIWDEAVLGWTKAYDSFTAGVTTGAATLVAQVVGFFQGLYDDLVGKSILTDLVDDAQGLFQTLYDNTLGKITSLKDDAVRKFEEMKTDITSKLTTLYNNASATLGLFYLVARTVIGFIKVYFDDLKKKVGEVLDKITALTNLGTAFQGFKDSIGDAVGKVGEFVKALVDAVIPTWPTTLYGVFYWMADKIQAAHDWLKKFLTLLANAVLPGWLTPGSATPFELALQGINEQLAEMRRNIGGLSNDLRVQVDHTGAAIGPGIRQAGITVNQFFNQGAFAGAFPGVRDGRDAQNFLRELDILIGQASAKASVPGGAT